jgi:hypothetical protein
MDQLIPYEPGTFLDPGADLSDPNCLPFYCERLLGRFPASPEEFELWLRNRSELESALDQAGTIRYIRMTLATGDEEASKSCRRFIEEVIPRFEACGAKLDRRALDIRKRTAHSPERHSVFFRRVENRVELYRPENIPLFTRDAVLCQEYLKICGAVTVRFRGEERTPQHMERFLIERTARFARRPGARSPNGAKGTPGASRTFSIGCWRPGSPPRETRDSRISAITAFDSWSVSITAPGNVRHTTKRWSAASYPC